MKRSVLFLLASLLFALFTRAQTNRALLVAISDYPIESGWGETHAVNDCDIVTPMLTAHGYKKKNIKYLLNEQATQKNILYELEQLQKTASKGDYIYIHFSGHGQQMFDDNGDEPDFLDESFIPYDTYYRYISGKYEGENHLRDDELEVLIDHIRYRIGNTGNVMVVMDACHSGTGTRYVSPVPLGIMPTDADHYKTDIHIVDKEDYIRGTSSIFGPDKYRQADQDVEAFSLRLKEGKNLAPVIVFSACQPDELNYEYRTGNPVNYYGSLSYFFCKLANELNLQEAESNRSFYLRLEKAMSVYFKKRNRIQTPYFECTDRDKRFIIGKTFDNPE